MSSYHVSMQPELHAWMLLRSRSVCIIFAQSGDTSVLRNVPLAHNLRVISFSTPKDDLVRPQPGRPDFGHLWHTILRHTDHRCTYLILKPTTYQDTDILLIIFDKDCERLRISQSKNIYDITYLLVTCWLFVDWIRWNEVPLIMIQYAWVARPTWTWGFPYF